VLKSGFENQNLKIKKVWGVMGYNPPLYEDGLIFI